MELAWENRDISPRHLHYFRECRALSSREWKRSGQRSRNCFGNYNARKQALEIHINQIEGQNQGRSSLLTALGASLLGNALSQSRWIKCPFNVEGPAWGYQVRLCENRERRCFFSARELRSFLSLIRFQEVVGEDDLYQTIALDRKNLLPPHLYLGLFYAWYLNNRYVQALDLELSILRWPNRILMPFQKEDKERKQALVDFFRKVIFGYPV